MFDIIVGLIKFLMYGLAVLMILLGLVWLFRPKPPKGSHGSS